MKKSVMSLLVLLLLVGVAGTAQAVPIPSSGGFATPTGATSPGGSLLATITVPFTGVANFIGGTVTQNVLSNATGILFEYIVNSTGVGSITQASASFFNNFTTDLDGPILPYVPPVGRVTRGADGETVTWDYINPAMTTGQSSGTLWVQTNANTYTTGIFSLLGADTATLNIYAPLSRPSTVPEPASMALLGVGLVGLVGRKLKEKFMA